MSEFNSILHKKKQINESNNFINRCKLNKYVIPFNVKINTTDNIILCETPKYYNEFSKKIQKIINLIDIYYINYVKNNILFLHFKSIHIANLVYKNQQNIKTNEYNRTYQNNEHITSFHAEHSVLTCCNKYNSGLGFHQKHNTILCVIRYDKSGKKCNSKPCGHCLYQIKKNNIKNIIYSANDDLFYYCKVK